LDGTQPQGLLRTALSGCCPRCGRGPLFKSFLALNDRCSVCRLDLSKADAGDGPAVFLIFILGFSVVPLALWVAMSVELPLWLHAVLWGAVILGITIGLLRPSKALTVALQYRHRRQEFDRS